jgi:hypothetical protein
LAQGKCASSTENSGQHSVLVGCPALIQRDNLSFKRAITTSRHTTTTTVVDLDLGKEKAVRSNF